MKTQLTSLRKLVLTTLPPISSHTNDAANHDQLKDSTNWANELPKIKEELMVHIHCLLLSKKDDKLVKRHLQETQKECISLLNYLNDDLPKLRSGKEFFQATAACLEEVLLHLLNSHQCYFDWEINAPSFQLLLVQQDVEEKISKLKAALRNKKIENELLELICNAFKKFTQLKFCSYQQINYMKVLLNSLLNMCNKVSNLKFDELIIEHLFYYNFNENAFIGYCKDKISQAIIPLYHAEAQYQKLCCFEKFLLAQQEKTACSFSPLRASARDQILTFVTAEINYLQKKQNYGSQQYSGKYHHEQPMTSYRVKVSLSADSLAYLLRLLTESEVILNEPRTKLLAFIAQHFQTAGIGQKLLSPQSLSTKYRQVNQHTAMGLKKLLLQMIKIVEQEFG